jgi:hypothetical protein
MGRAMSRTDIAHPSTPVPLAEADVYAAVRAFVLDFTPFPLEPANVVMGWQNRASLPPGTNEYAMISVLFDTRRGTAVETFQADDPDPARPGILSIRGLIEVQVQVDFCGENDLARQRARCLALVAGSSLGVQFFNDRGMSALYADDVRDLTFVGDSQQFVRRYMTTLHLTLVEGAAFAMDFFDQAKISRLEDVDAHHKP